MEGAVKSVNTVSFHIIFISPSPLLSPSTSPNMPSPHDSHSHVPLFSHPLSLPPILSLPMHSIDATIKTKTKCTTTTQSPSLTLPTLSQQPLLFSPTLVVSHLFHPPPCLISSRSPLFAQAHHLHRSLPSPPTILTHSCPLLSSPVSLAISCSLSPYPMFSPRCPAPSATLLLLFTLIYYM